MIGRTPGQWSATGTYPGDGVVGIVDNLAGIASGTARTARKGACVHAANPRVLPAPGIGPSPVSRTRAGATGCLPPGSACARGADPQAYLRAVIEELPERKSDDIDDLLPEEWAKADREAHPYREPERPADRRLPGNC